MKPDRDDGGTGGTGHHNNLFLSIGLDIAAALLALCLTGAVALVILSLERI